MYKFLDFIASLALVFNVDWETDYEDDAYVVAMRKENER